MPLQYLINTKIGKIYLVASEKGLTAVLFKKQNIPLIKKLDKKIVTHKWLLQTEKQLLEYFKQKRVTFDIPLDLVGTDFQKKVWSELLQIPYGKTISYKELAIRIKNPKAVRAVGTANGKNPICLIIPCHRVITNSGKIGGYSGGIEIKKNLLLLESNN